MIEACVADGRLQEASEYLEVAVQQDTSFGATPIFKQLEQKVTVRR